MSGIKVSRLHTGMLTSLSRLAPVMTNGTLDRRK
jgi:hypothetical protein